MHVKMLRIVVWFDSILQTTKPLVGEDYSTYKHRLKVYIILCPINLDLDRNFLSI